MNRLTVSQVEQVQRATEDPLESVAVQVMHDGLLQRARTAGAQPSVLAVVLGAKRINQVQSLSDCFEGGES
jgi:hypothetical protein